MNNKKLQIAGVMLYACEGTKARRDYRGENRYNYSIELTNSDPKIISTFTRFSKEVLKVDWDRVRGQLFIYPDLDEKELIEFWSKISEIPITQFQKTIILKAKIGKFKANPLGTLKFRYSCKKDFVRLQEMIDKTWADMK